jgi:acetyl esterase/lipase
MPNSNYHPSELPPRATSRRSQRFLAFAPFTLASTLALLLAGCSSSSPGNPGPAPETGGAAGGAVAQGTAGSSALPTGLAGSSSIPTGNGGSDEGPSAGSSAGPPSGGVSAGGASASAGGASGSGAGGKANGSGGAPPSAGAGPAGGGTSTSFPTAPPVQDTASKVPIMRAPAGYTVLGNFAYGPETAQRIDVLFPTGGGPKATSALPAVLMFHGGAWIHSYNNGSGKDHMTTFSDRFLAHGFIVCNAEYRVSDGSADAAPAPAAVEDALLAAKWCWNYLDYFHGDRTKYVVTGASAGGHLALMVGMTTPAAMLGATSPADYKIAAIVSGYGPADIEAELNGVAAAWLPASLPNRAAIAKEVNPMTYVRKDIPPLIVVQGANDNTAPVRDSQSLVTKLTAAGADASIHLVPGAGHGFTAGAEWNDAEKAMFDWLVGKGIGK